MTVENFVGIVWTVFEKVEIFIERSGEKERHDCIKVENFPTPKKLRREHFSCGRLKLKSANLFNKR